MLEGLSSKEAQVEIIYKFSDRGLPVEGQLLEEAIGYYLDKNPERAARLCREVGKNDLAGRLYGDLSVKSEEEGGLYDAIKYARWSGNGEREKELQMKDVKECVDKGNLRYAAESAEHYGLYKLAIDCHILRDVGRRLIEGVPKAAGIAENHDSEGNLWGYFAQKCIETGDRELMETSAKKLEENERYPLALEIYKLLEDKDKIVVVAGHLGQDDLALSTLLKENDYVGAEIYVGRRGIEDRLPQIYEHALRHYEAEGNPSIAAKFAKELNRIQEAISLYEKAEGYENAAWLAQENGRPKVYKECMKKQFQKLKDLGNHPGALEVAKKIGIKGEKLKELKLQALDYNERHFYIEEALAIAQELGLDEKIKTYSTLLFLKEG